VKVDVRNTLAVVDVERRALRQARFITEGMVVLRKELYGDHLKL
jgi:hypothetical protein